MAAFKHALSSGICVEADAQHGALEDFSADFGDPKEHEQWPVLAWLFAGFFWGMTDDILPSYVGIIIKTHGSRDISRDPYEQTRIPIGKS